MIENVFLTAVVFFVMAAFYELVVAIAPDDELGFCTVIIVTSTIVMFLSALLWIWI